ncbi:MAG: tryptophan synthase subunit beta [Simkaniaceae bacterium]|nr:tryptophan synthase subunit beta [Simkaniaceae bacterium]
MLEYGGQFVPEILFEPLKELERAWNEAKGDPLFREKFHALLKSYVGRPTPITRIDHFSRAIDGPQVFLKREDLNHTGSHKINNAMGQCLLAKRMGKTKIIAETGAGQHGVATATACAYFGLECVVYMGSLDVARQSQNVDKMHILGAEVIPVDKGDKTLKEAVNEALRAWALDYETAYYCLGSALGPHPYPEMVAWFQEVIGLEIQGMLKPDVMIACIGGGSNAIGFFSPFLNEPVRMIGVEALYAARMQTGRPGVLHGSYTYVLQNEDGQIGKTTSIAAGLDYPAIGPMHAKLKDSGRVEYVAVGDLEAVAAFKLLARTEGIIPALESSHALAYLMKIGRDLPKESLVIVNLSGRGEKDICSI